MTSDEPRTGLIVDQRPGGVLLLTIDRPEARNAMDARLRRDLRRALRVAEADEAVHAVVLTGAGGIFSSGLDLREGLGSRDVLAERDTPAAAARRMTKPVIAAVDGPCFTGALELALSCSFIVASPTALFADTHAALGLIDGWGGSALLPRTVGIRMARRMMTTGERVDAATALRCGLVTEVAEDAVARALHVAGQIAAADRGAVRETLRLLDAGDGGSVSHAIALETEAGLSWQIDANAVAERFGARTRSETSS